VDVSIVSRQAHEGTHHDGHSEESEPHFVSVHVPHGVLRKRPRDGAVFHLRRHLGETFRNLALQKKGGWTKDT
jgi:hypothetical protein